MSEERVRLHIDEAGIATVSLVRSEKHNALDGAMFMAIDGAIKQLREDDSVRVVVLHGEGKSFCSGLDIASLMASNGDGPSLSDLGTREGAANLFQFVSYGWTEVPVPVICAIHGNCFGGGMQIALGADIRIAAPDAKLSIMEIKWGLVPDMGATAVLPRLMSIDVAKELTYTGRVVSGDEADSLGLVTRTAADPLAAARELAEEIAGKSPDAIRFDKRLLDETWANDDVPAALRLESELQARLLGSPNQLAAVTAGMTRQPAQFGELLPSG